jgi:hypothetical protein
VQPKTPMETQLQVLLMAIGFAHRFPGNGVIPRCD